jgi:hypothetical protein
MKSQEELDKKIKDVEWELRAWKDARARAQEQGTEQHEQFCANLVDVLEVELQTLVWVVGVVGAERVEEVGG